MENIGTITDEIKKLLSIDSNINEILINNVNFKKHLMNRNHQNIIPHIPNIQHYLKNPAYVGIKHKRKKCEFRVCSISKT